MFLFPILKFCARGRQALIVPHSPPSHKRRGEVARRRAASKGDGEPKAPPPLFPRTEPAPAAHLPGQAFPRMHSTSQGMDGPHVTKRFPAA